MLVYGLYRSLPTQPATGTSEDMPREPSEVDADSRRQKNVQNIFGVLRRQAWRDLDYIRAVGNQAFREKESRGQFSVVSRSPHGDGYTSSSNADFERLLASD